jgi:ribosomal protein S6
MKNYELAYIITPDLSAEEAKTLSEKMAGFVSELSGAVLHNADPEKRKLGYPIKGKIEAWLASLEFSLLPEKTIELKKKVISENQILRHLMVAKAKKRIKPKKIRQLADREPKEKKEGAAEEKVDIEKINEKIDEILK